MIQTVEELIIVSNSNIAIRIYCADKLLKDGYIKTAEQYLRIINGEN